MISVQRKTRRPKLRLKSWDSEGRHAPRTEIMLRVALTETETFRPLGNCVSDQILRGVFSETNSVTLMALKEFHHAISRKALSLRQTWRCLQHRHCSGRPHRQSHGRPKAERQSSSGRSPSSGAACGIQVFGDRDGLLGSGRPTKIYGQVDGRVTQAVEDYGQGMGRIRGRSLVNAGQIQSACRGASRTK